MINWEEKVQKVPKDLWESLTIHQKFSYLKLTLRKPMGEGSLDEFCKEIKRLKEFLNY
jgi:hypothetical protein